MSSYYFNHAYLINHSQDTAIIPLREIATLSEELRKHSSNLSFSPQIWSTPLQPTGIGLRDFLLKLRNPDEPYVTIRAIVDGGPFYTEVLDPKVIIYPSLANSEQSHPITLLHSCYHEKQDIILSLINENFLTNSSYVLNHPNGRRVVKNLFGLSKLQEYLQEIAPYQAITDVFEAIERLHPKIFISNKAKKKSSRFDFRDKLADVFNAIVALEKLDMPKMIKTLRESQVQNRYYEETGFKISKESPETMNHPVYREQRQADLPNGTTKIFEWHIKIRSTQAIRIYYYINPTNDQICIGHCGEHLGTVSGY